MKEELLAIAIFIGLFSVFFIGFIGLSKINFTSYGEHNGYVTAVDQQGMIWKNYRVYVKTDNQSSQEDIYCVPFYNEELANRLRAISKKRERVNLQYKGLGLSSMFPSECAGQVITGFAND